MFAFTSFEKIRKTSCGLKIGTASFFSFGGTGGTLIRVPPVQNLGFQVFTSRKPRYPEQGSAGTP